MTRVVSIVLACAVAACARVAPYERGRLAHPTMEPSDGATLAREHMHAIHEGATGGGTQAASGCGCN